MSSSSKAVAAKLIGERLAIMRSVRKINNDKFKANVDEMIQAGDFVQGECMVFSIAKRVVRAFGLSPNCVKMVPMYNGWTSAEFTHTVKTPMPPPPGKGMKKELPVETVTTYKVIKANAEIRVVREYCATKEVETNLEGDVLVKEYQRPSRQNTED